MRVLNVIPHLVILPMGFKSRKHLSNYTNIVAYISSIMISSINYSSGLLLHWCYYYSCSLQLL
jgi:hypothetical protein